MEVYLIARRFELWDTAAVALLACTAIFVLAVPVFPTQDGPVHLYYVDILRDLLRHSGPFAQHFEIKSFLTPYALEYYSLLALESVFPATVSEKLLICGYVFAFGLGFRYLVGSVAEPDNPWTLVGIPFCMNVLVYMGFLNYCVGVALALFLFGFWIRYWMQLSARRITILLFGLIFMLLTHPVPVAVFLLFTGVHFCVDLAREAASGSGLWIQSLRNRLRPLVMIAVMAALSAAWVSLFVNHSPQDPFAARKAGFDNVISVLKLSGIAPFRVPAYRLGLESLLAIAGLACVAAMLKHGVRASSPAIALLTTSTICFALFCFMPLSINGSGYFANRFAIFWIMFFIAAAAGLHPPPRWSLAAGVMAFAVTCALLPMQWAIVSRIAREIRPALDTPPAQPGSVGLIISEPRYGDASRAGPGSVGSIGEPKYAPDLSFDPFLWSGAHYFRRSKAILANAPWMDLPIIMIRPLNKDRWSFLDPPEAKSSLRTALNQGDAVPELGSLVIVGPSDTETEEIISLSHSVELTNGNQEIRIFSRIPSR